MYLGKKRNIVGLGAMLLVLLSFTGCDPKKMVDKYFAENGLNRLAPLRDDIDVGAIILARNKIYAYKAHVLDYIEDKDSDWPFPTFGSDEIKAVLEKYEGEGAIEASLALDFLETFLPVKIKKGMKLTGKVSIGMVNAKVRRTKIPEVETFFTRVASRPFQRAVLKEMGDGNEVYLVYETWRTNKLKIVADGNRDISSEVSVGEVKPLVSKGDSKFTYKRTSKSEIEIEGDTFYVFAVKTAKLEREGSSDKLKFQIMTGLRPGPISKGSDERYAAPLLGNFEPIKISR